MNKKTRKIFLFITFTMMLLLSIGIPTLARFKGRVTIYSSNWDGTIADSYRAGDGSIDNPYIISNARELAYFSQQLEDNNYSNTYFSLSKDIMINDGLFTYDEIDGIKYTTNNVTYYVDEYRGEYYSDNTRTGTKEGTVNIFNSLTNFDGFFNGNSHTIYGLYITSELDDKLGLFTNLTGDVFDLYLDNAFIYGGHITGGISSNSDSANIKNTMFNGYVIGEKINLEQTTSIDLEMRTYNITNSLNTINIDLSNSIPFYGSEIISSSISGSYTLNGSADVKINNVLLTDNTFNISLGNTLLDSVDLTLIGTNQSTISFTDVKYNIVYNYGVSGGIDAIAVNTNIVSSVNKGIIDGYYVAGGIVGSGINTEIESSYNKGDIKGSTVGGLVGVIEKCTNCNISYSYNDGNVIGNTLGGMVGVTDNSILGIQNSFNTKGYSIGNIANSAVDVDNCYYVSNSFVQNGLVNGSPVLTTISNLTNKNYMITNLLMNEFVAISDLDSNPSNIWVYEDDMLPVLYLDDQTNYVASIHVSTYTFTNVTDSIGEINLNSDITFSIENAPLVFLKEIHYYITDEVVPILSSSETISSLNWIPYSVPITISEEGKYVIYAKVVDNNDKVTYLNTDLIYLDKTLPVVSTTLNDDTWNDFSEKDNIYLDRDYTLNIESTDNLSGVMETCYYISNTKLSLVEVGALESTDWICGNTIDVMELGIKNIYIRVIDESGNETIINTPSLIYDGYVFGNISLGRNNLYDNTNKIINNNSSITFNIDYQGLTTDIYSHQLISNQELPQDTIITIIDNNTSKRYKYQIINNGETIYPFTMFTEVGGNLNYVETTSMVENYTIIIDFSEANLSTDYEDVMIYLELHDNANCIRPTLNNSKKAFTVLKNKDASLNISIDNVVPINYDIDAVTNLNIESNIDYQKVNDKDVIDTTFEDMKMGLFINLVDEENNVLDSKYLLNFKFMIGLEEFHVVDGGVHINLGQGFNKNVSLSITSYKSNSDLSDGTYYLKITNYMSYDGIYINYIGNSVSIPVVKSSDDINVSYSFNVFSNDEERIIDKSSDAKMSFDIIQSGDLENPNIRVSLYKKALLGAFDQTYTLIDLGNVVTDSLVSIMNGIYQVTDNPLVYDGTSNTYNHFEINFNKDMLEYNGYKIIFELFDSTKRVGKIEKYFIVK